MKTSRMLLILPIAVLVAAACAGTQVPLGVPTVVSETAFDVAPEVTNPEEVREAMREGYPPLLRDAGIRGNVTLLALVDETGQIQRVSLEEGSGHRALDELALELARMIRFRPAQYEGAAVPVSVKVPMTLAPPPPGRATRRGIGGDDGTTTAVLETFTLR